MNNFLSTKCFGLIVALSFGSMSAMKVVTVQLAPLYQAAHDGDLDLVQRLVNYSNINSRDPLCDETPLHWAAWKGRLEVVRFLLKERC